MAEGGERKQALCESYKATNPIHEGSTLIPHLILIISPKPHLLISLQSGIGFQHMVWRHQLSVHNRIRWYQQVIISFIRWYLFCAYVGKCPYFPHMNSLEIFALHYFRKKIKKILQNVDNGYIFRLRLQEWNYMLFLHFPFGDFKVWHSLEMQILGPQSGPTESGTLGVDSRNGILTSPPGYSALQIIWEPPLLGMVQLEESAWQESYDSDSVM